MAADLRWKNAADLILRDLTPTPLLKERGSRTHFQERGSGGEVD